MRAIVLEKFGGLDSLVYKEIPDPEAFSINHAEAPCSGRRRSVRHKASCVAAGPYVTPRLPSSAFAASRSAVANPSVKRA